MQCAGYRLGGLSGPRCGLIWLLWAGLYVSWNVCGRWIVGVDMRWILYGVGAVAWSSLACYVGAYDVSGMCAGSRFGRAWKESDHQIFRRADRT